MSKELYETRVAKDAARRFRMLCEYTFNITEDDGEEDMMGQEEGEIPPTPEGGEGAGMPEPEGEMGGEMPSVEGETSTPEGETTEGGAPGFNPEEGAGMPEPEGEFGDEIQTDSMQPDDEVIDIDELTDSQEKTEEKVDDIQISMEKGFEKLLDVVQKLDKMIDMSTNNMEQIKQEIEKRNPTPMEKLNMRAANDSYPFNVKPDDYWKKKEATSNYRIGGEDEPDAVQYTITKGDIDNITDFRKISQDLSSSELSQNLMNIFGLR